MSRKPNRRDDLAVPRPKPEGRAHVVWLTTPRRLLGEHGPLMVGVMSDAPRELLAEWARS